MSRPQRLHLRFPYVALEATAISSQEITNSAPFSRPHNTRSHAQVLHAKNHTTKTSSKMVRPAERQTVPRDEPQWPRNILPHNHRPSPTSCHNSQIQPCTRAAEEVVQFVRWWWEIRGHHLDSRHLLSCYELFCGSDDISCGPVPRSVQPQKGLIFKNATFAQKRTRNR